jgi:hypothetical protein
MLERVAAAVTAVDVVHEHRERPLVVAHVRRCQCAAVVVGASLVHENRAAVAVATTTTTATTAATTTAGSNEMT